MSPSETLRILELSKEALSDALIKSKNELPMWAISRLTEIRDIAQKDIDSFIAEEQAFGEKQDNSGIPF